VKEVATKVQMPMLGLTMTEGSITKWLKREGDFVRKGEPLFEVETDKALAEVEAPEEGVLLKILARESCPIAVGAAVAILGAEGEDASRIVAEGQQTPSVDENQGISASTKPSRPTAARLISPRARRLAEKHHIDWENLEGSGTEGQITERDIQLQIEKTRKSAPVRPLSRIRQIIGERLTQSQQERAHIYLTSSLDMAEAVALRNLLLEEAAAQATGRKTTYSDLCLKALGICLTEHPWMNSSFTDDGIRLHASANIGLAVALEDDGLVVPVIRDVQALTLGQISDARQVLVKKARERRLLPDEMTGGTFTLSNLGMYGVEQFTAIINPPETGILAIGAITDEPRVVRGGIFIRPVMHVTLGVDHRIVDGAIAGRFLQRFKALMEQPSQLTDREK
jgi:pyruvate dehydrogenase E2 component (dihydrolipoamide acetyltransferase)